MPLTESVSFKATLQKGYRIQLPRLIRWHYKMGPEQALQVNVRPEGLGYNDEEFLARMTKDGRITIPKKTLELLEEKPKNLVGCVLRITLTPL